VRSEGFYVNEKSTDTFEATTYANYTIKYVVIWDTLTSLAERKIYLYILSTVSLYDLIT
jgi:hypothetical protein